MDFVSEVLHFILQEQMFAPGDKVVVAVSGGPDSVALLDVLFRLRGRLGIELHVAHLDHRFRGAESKADAEFVRQLASRLGLAATIEERDVPEFIRKYKLSAEEGAREIRYQFLQEVAQKVGAAKIATAHNLDDQAETILLHLLRGAGRKGLAGILPLRDGIFVRPLLKMSRQQIEEYLSQRKLPYRYDSSNSDVSYARNKIRHLLLPLLKREYNPDIISTLTRTAEILQQEDAFLEQQALQVLPSTVKQRDRRKIILDINSFLDYHICLRRRILRNILQDFLGRGYYPEFNQIEQLVRLADSGAGWVQITSELRAQRYGDLLIIKRGKIPPFQKEIEVPGKVDIPELNACISAQILTPDQLEGKFPFGGKRQVAFLDLDTLRGELQVRSRLPGDSLQPLGLEGHKKVKDLLIDRKVPKILRDEIPLLVDQEKIVWVMGIEINERCKVTPETRRILKIQFQPNP